jgi:hypothetical protein
MPEELDVDAQLPKERLPHENNAAKVREKDFFFSIVFNVLTFLFSFLEMSYLLVQKRGSASGSSERALAAQIHEL